MLSISTLTRNPNRGEKRLPGSDADEGAQDRLPLRIRPVWQGIAAVPRFVQTRAVFSHGAGTAVLPSAASTIIRPMTLRVPRVSQAASICRSI